MDRAVLKSPAKINLGLSVGARRTDGFHDLVTIIVPLDFGDAVMLRRTSSGITVNADSARVPSGPKNLAHRAAAAFFEKTSIKAGCRIDIRKRIPVGGGLGGGSANAATTLMGLNRLFGRPLSPAALHKIGSALGSDVPAFLFGGPCVARGRGERVRRISLPRLTVLLYLPRHQVSTAWAYAELDRRRASDRDLTPSTLSPRLLGLYLRHNELNKAAALVRNDFEPVVFGRFPTLARARDVMLNHGAYAACLSGSGSTVYGLVTTQRWKDPMAALARRGFHCVKTTSL